MLALAIDKAGTADDVVAVAKALEGMTFDSKLLNTKVYMRPQDHQAIQNLHIGDHSADVEFDMDNSGYGMKIFKTVEMASMDSPTTCKMKRP
jgi:branched-chain amino acid transport system substrate-binding protein